MSDQTNTWIDPKKRASDQLNSAIKTPLSEVEDIVVLDERLLKEEQEKESESDTNETPIEAVPDPVEAVAVDVARTEAPLLNVVTHRQKVRLLILTKDTSILEDGSAKYRHVSGLRDLFLEIHVVLLNHKTGKEEVPVMRLFENVWVYPTNSGMWWMSSYHAYSTAEKQLVFSGNIRADVIVSEDLFESGLAGWFLSKKYSRPFQLHVTEDFYDDAYVEQLPYPSLYQWSAEYLLKRVTSVRTKTEFQRQAVVEENKNLEATTELLPTYYNLDIWRDAVPTVNLQEKYPQFKFIILHISAMRSSSHSSEVIEGVAMILNRYSSVGLVIAGNGPLRSNLEHQVIALGIQSQVEFEPMPDDAISYMKSAHVMIQLSDNGTEDELILEAAVSKIPLIANEAGLAGKLFKDGESAYLCSSTEKVCIADTINMYLNKNQDRARFALTASQIVFDRIEQDYNAYLQACSLSIERCMVGVSYIDPGGQEQS